MSKHLSQTVQPKSSSPLASQYARRPGLPTVRIGGANREIALALLAVAFPMLLLSAILLGVVFANRVDQKDLWFRSLEYPSAADDTSAFYIHYEAARFATVASWTSSVAPLLSSFVMLLFSFSAANGLRPANSSHANSQPTPFQFNLLLQALGGGLGAVVSLLGYGKWKRRAKLVRVVVSTYAVLFTIMILSYAIWACDTWLHVTTTATQLVLSNPDNHSFRSFGRGFNSTCVNDTEIIAPCTEEAGNLYQAESVFQTMMNFSADHLIAIAQMQNDDYAYLTSPIIPKDVDYQASSFAVSTSCRSVIPECRIINNSTIDTLPEGGAVGFNPVLQTSFNCSSALHGSFPSTSSNNTFATNIVFASSDDPRTASEISSPARKNPFHFLAVTATQSFNPALVNDSHVNYYTIPDAEGLSSLQWLLMCTSSIYHVEYVYVNNTLFSFRNITLVEVPESPYGIPLTSPFEDAYSGSSLATQLLTSNALVSSSEPTIDLLTSTYEMLFSRNTAALAAGIMVPVPNINETISTFGSRVPKAPLFTLIIFNVAYVLFALALAMVAWASDPTRTKDAQARLSILGLVALHFEPQQSRRPVRDMKHMFGEWDGIEPGRIGLVGTATRGLAYELVQQELITQDHGEVEGGETGHANKGGSRHRSFEASDSSGLHRSGSGGDISTEEEQQELL